MKKEWRLAIFASGSGSNAQNIIEHFNDLFNQNIVLMATNNPGAYVIERAKRLGVPYEIFTRSDLTGNKVLTILQDYAVNFIVLAGFLWLIPPKILHTYPNRIVNIHPALLPEYGGKGMYGVHVHEAVIDNHETESGITIHYVNEEYDSGDIIFQSRCPVLPGDTPDALARRIHQLEYEYYPRVIEDLLNNSD